MKFLYTFVTIVGLILIFLSIGSCNSIQPVLLLKPLDFITIPLYYIGASFVFAFILSICDNSIPFKKHFLRNIFFTPVFGLIKIAFYIYKTS